MNVKVIALVGDAPNQHALVQKLHAVHPLAKLVLVRRGKNARKTPLGTRLASATFGFPLRAAWRHMMRRYADARIPLSVSVMRTDSANSPEVVSLMNREKPDLVLVSGTDLLRQTVIDAISRRGRIMNLHTGISPYIKGGPNCTNWALATKRFSQIGNTIMWLDAGIDSGNLIATERTALNGKEKLTELHVKVMEHAHDLYCRCYCLAVSGNELPSVPQKRLGKGTLFLSRQWNWIQILKANYNFFRFYSRAIMELSDDLDLVSVENKTCGSS